MAIPSKKLADSSASNDSKPLDISAGFGAISFSVYVGWDPVVSVGVKLLLLVCEIGSGGDLRVEGKALVSTEAICAVPAVSDEFEKSVGMGESVCKLEFE